MPAEASVYVHFPWCLRLCPYCDFAVRTIDRQDVPHRGYADALMRELDWRSSVLSQRRLVSVYFGGGTPSLWEPTELGRVLDAIRRTFATERAELEITAECNPYSLDQRKAAGLRQAGVNRLSVGVQSLRDDRLRFLGRRHDGRGAVRALQAAVAEVPRVTADVMFGLPGQAAAELVDDVSRIVDTGVSHASAYALTIEPDTLFGHLARRGKTVAASEEDYASQFIELERAFATHGFEHYEVSSYGQPGQHGRHNEHYWKGGAYVGLGAAAVGCLDGGVGRARRWRNEPEPQQYATRAGDGTVEQWEEPLGPHELVREALMLGLRTRAGVDLHAVQRRSGVDPLSGREAVVERLRGRGDLVVERGRLRVPPARWLHLDGIVTDLF